MQPVEVKNLRLVVLQNKGERNKEFEDDLVRLSESRTVGIDVLALSKQGAVVDVRDEVNPQLRGALVEQSHDQRKI